MAIVDKVVSRARVEEGYIPPSTGISPTNSCAQDNKGNIPTGALIHRAFDCRTTTTHRDGQRVAPDPDWTAWPHHTAADMAPSAWPSVRQIEAERQAKRNREINRKTARLTKR